VAAAAAIFSVLHRDSSRSKRRGSEPSPAPSATSADRELESAVQAERDRGVQAQVERALRSNPRTRRQGIEVEVEEGVVTLSGRATVAAAREAEAMARHLDGVSAVVNAIDMSGDENAGGPAAPAPPGAPHVGPSLPALPPPGVRHGRPPADPEAVQRLLREAREALRAGHPGEAMAKYGAVIGMDPANDEARRGMKEAGLLLGETIRRKLQPSPSPS